MPKKHWLLLFSALWLLSCSGESPVPDKGWGYFPLDEGLYRIYDVTETVYNSQEETVSEYQLRERIANGQEAEAVKLMVIERRETDQEPWVAVQSVHVRRTNHMLEYREDNVPFVKLIFPLRTGREWDGNALNDDVEMTYSYASEGTPDQMRLVISDLPENFVRADTRYEIYEDGVGMRSRYYEVVDYCQGCAEAFVPENGRILVQELIEYGAE